MPATVTTAHLNLENELQSRLGATGVAVVCTGVDGDPDSLWPEEQASIASAIPRRQREFAAGRHAARAAMRRLHHTPRAIPAHEDRSPQWPDRVIGSIAHDTGACVAVVGTRERWTSIGVDIEADIGLEESLWPLVCTRDELQHLHQLPPAQRAPWAKRVFVAKEAFYKWHYPQQRTLLDFQDVSVKWSGGGLAFDVLQHRGATPDRLVGCNGHVFSLDGRVVAYCST